MINQIDNTQAGNHLSKAEVSRKLSTFLKSLDSLGEKTKSEFKPELLHHLKALSQDLKSMNESPNRSLSSITQSTTNFLQHLSEIDPTFLEAEIEDLKLLKKKKSKNNIQNLIDLKEQLLVNFSYKSDVNNTHKLTPIKGNFETKLKSFNSLLSSQFESYESLLKDGKLTLGKITGLGIALKHLPDSSHSAVYKTANAHPLVKLVGDFDTQEILEMISALLDNKVPSLDDLATLISLLKELGLSAPANLISEINNFIKEFIEDMASKASSPLDIIVLINTIKQLAQSVTAEGLDVSNLPEKIQDLIENDPNKNIKTHHLSELASIQPGFKIESISLYDKEPSEIAEQVAGIQKFKATPDSQAVYSSTQSLSPAIEQATTLSQSNQEQNQKDQSTPNAPQKEIETEIPVETKNAYNSFLNSLNSLVESQETNITSSLLTMMAAIYKGKLEASLDSTLDNAINSL